MPTQTGITLSTPLREVAGLPRRVADRLHGIGIVKVGQLIAYLPMRHERHEAEAPIAELTPGRIVSARGEITATRPVMRPHTRRPRFEAVLVDPTGRLDLVWFNQTYLHRRLEPGMRLRVQGQARRRGHLLQMVNPAFRVIEDAEPEPAGARWRAVYPGTQAVPSKVVEEAMAAVLPMALPHVEDHLPEAYRAERDLPALRDAYRMIHAPTTEEEMKAARRRLAYDELLLLQLGVHLKRAQTERTVRAPALACPPEVDRRIRARLPFALTPAQDVVVRDVARDLGLTRPASRLIQGDVGSGKTLVAAYAMLLAVANGHQAALMAPTEILAEQHAAGLGSMLAGSRVRSALLTRAVGAPARRDIRQRLAAGELDLVVGTHALITDSTRFRSLALVIVDEQHRFGVHQRAALRDKAGLPGLAPHMLVMTATPIPRTLALTLFGELDISTIRGLPPGRLPVSTRWVRREQRDEVYAWLRRRLERREQAFIVVPVIDAEGGESASDSRGVSTLTRELAEGALAGLRIAAVHGRLRPRTRERIMGRFRAGQIDALVATTVVEVGVDVPNATVMVVEHAERFGLSQLHQLRGRVGRGTRRSACVLIGDPTTPEALARLETLATISDGFALADKDLELRGPGEVFGTRQAGLPPFRVADLARDLDLLSMARRDAQAWIARSPDLGEPSERLVRRRLMKTYGHALGLSDVG